MLNNKMGDCGMWVRFYHIRDCWWFLGQKVGSVLFNVIFIEQCSIRNLAVTQWYCDLIPHGPIINSHYSPKYSQKILHSSPVLSGNDDRGYIYVREHCWLCHELWWHNISIRDPPGYDTVILWPWYNIFHFKHSPFPCSTPTSQILTIDTP